MFNATDLATVGFLVFLEGVLSLDNALVLALMVRHLPPPQRRRALTYGVWGAFAFRFVALFALRFLMNASWVKFVGGGYLAWIALSNLLAAPKPGDAKPKDGWGRLTFWRTILAVELMDVAFSVDSILAAVSLSRNYFVVLTGGILGIVMMRFAASVFGRLIDAFPRMERTAYLLVLTIGTKLLVQGVWGTLDFHSIDAPAAWFFWLTMAACIALGFRQPFRSKKGEQND